MQSKGYKANNEKYSDLVAKWKSVRNRMLLQKLGEFVLFSALRIAIDSQYSLDM